ncbi:MAG: DUF1934 domain-containing protein [Lachnospiraceae bacterium]|nr:DUF1934 domain-containing protein [Lachnospiraceae bacterium]
MTEDILISVKGLHTLDNEEEDQEIEVFSAGKYYFRNGRHYILYEEQAEDNGELIKNRITLKDGCMEVQKKGPVNSKMVFEQDKKNSSWYNTPFGNLMAGTTVTDMSVTEEEDLIDIRVSYELEVNYERVANCNIQIKVMAKDSGLFSLR